MLTVAVSASTATVAPGGTVTYTITATNSGQTTLTGATFTDPLANVLDDASYGNDASATAGSVSFASSNLTWTGNLAVGASATITFSVTVKNPDTGNKVLANTVTSAVPGSNCPAGATAPDCAVTVAVVPGPLTITAPATASLGSIARGGTLRSHLGTVQVTDDRGVGASWTATVSSTNFATSTGTEAETIPASDAQYDITALTEAIGPATFTMVPVTQLSASPQAVVSATNVAGNTTVSWDPIIGVDVPANAIIGGYTATITHSVS
jgi:large repetitive protein